MECRSLDGVDIEDLGWFLIFPPFPFLVLEGLVKVIDSIAEWVFLPLEAAGVLGDLHSVIGFELAFEKGDEGEDQKHEGQEANRHQVGGYLCFIGRGYRSSPCWGRVAIGVRVCIGIRVSVCVRICVSVRIGVGVGIGTRISVRICGSGRGCSGGGDGQVDIGGRGGDDPVANIADDKPNLEAWKVYLVIVELSKGQPYPASVQTSIEKNLPVLSSVESIYPANQRHIAVVLNCISKTMIQVILIFDCIVLSFHIITRTDKIIDVYKQGTHSEEFESGVAIHLQQELLVVVRGIHVGFDRAGGHSDDVVHRCEGESQEERDNEGVGGVETDGNREGEGAHPVAVAHSEGMGCLNEDMRTLMEIEVSTLWRLG